MSAALVDYIEEMLAEFLEPYDIKLSADDLKQLAKDIDLGIDSYNEIYSYTHDYTNPLEDKVRTLTKTIEGMHTAQSYKHIEDTLDQVRRDNKRLRLLVDELQQRINNNV